MALIPTNLPRTDARTVPSITIKIQNKNNQSVSIGAIKSMDRTMTRETSRRFELDQAIPGRTVEIVPGKITGLSLTISRAVLYTGTILEALGYEQEELVLQNIPFEISEIRHASDGSGKTQEVKYIGCYFTSNPMRIDIDGDWQIVQDATVEVGWVEVTGTRTAQ